MALIRKAEKGSVLIGVVAQRDPEVEQPIRADLYDMGVYAKVLKMLTLPNGNITAIIQGLGRLRLMEIQKYKPYLIGHVAPAPEEEPGKRDMEFQTGMEDLRSQTSEYIKMSDDIPEEAAFAIKNVSNNLMALNFICSNLPFSVKEKIALLTLDSIKERLFNAMRIVNREINLQTLKLDIRNKTRDDIDEPATRRATILTNNSVITSCNSRLRTCRLRWVTRVRLRRRNCWRKQRPRNGLRRLESSFIRRLRSWIS